MTFVISRVFFAEITSLKSTFRGSMKLLTHGSYKQCFVGGQWIFPWEKKSWNHNCQNAGFFFFLIFGTFGLLVDSRNLFHYFKKLLPQIFYEKATRRQFLAEKSHVTLARKLRSKQPEKNLVKSQRSLFFSHWISSLYWPTVNRFWNFIVILIKIPGI